MNGAPNKDHWYDGWIYDALLAPFLDGLFRQIVELVEPGSTVVDIGCGTGRLTLQLAGKCRTVLGIDLSRRNIAVANKALARKNPGNVVFRHDDAGRAFGEGERYDYAVMTLLLHEVDAGERLKLLAEASRVADRIIVGDYLVPSPGALSAALVVAVEFAAGPGHYRNYKDFIRGGGIRGLAAKAGLDIVCEVKSNPRASHLMVLDKKGTARPFHL